MAGTEQKPGALQSEAIALMGKYGLLLPAPVRGFIQKLAAKLDQLEKEISK